MDQSREKGADQGSESDRSDTSMQQQEQFEAPQATKAPEKSVFNYDVSVQKNKPELKSSQEEQASVQIVGAEYQIRPPQDGTKTAEFDDNPVAHIVPQTVQLPERFPEQKVTIIDPAEEEEKKSLERSYEHVVTEVQSRTQKTSIKDFTTLKVLGEGTYGKVLLVLHKKTGKYFAMKVLKKKNIIKFGQVTHTISERRILERMQHPFIVKLQYAFKDRERLYFVLNYCHGGELHFYICHCQRFKLDYATFYAANILLALKYLHENNIIYRDLKPENVLIDADGFALLTDFGLSKENMTGDEQGKARSLVGTAEYLAPEILDSKPEYGFACDWWSFGVLLYEMIAGLPPFYSTDRRVLFDNIRNQEVTFYKCHDTVTRDLLYRLLAKEPRMRLADPEEIMEHQFFAKINWQKMLARQCTTPYKPEITGPLDLSHFEAEYTNKPHMLSPPSPQSHLRQTCIDQQTQSYQAKTKADLFAAASCNTVEGEKDEFGDDFYFSQSPTLDVDLPTQSNHQNLKSNEIDIDDI